MAFVAVYFFQNGCPLCGKNHEVKFYIYVERQVISEIDAVVKIFVVRIFCETNYKLRIKTKEPLQYTITVLPAFLIPYCRVQIDLVLQAFNLYLKKNIKNQYAAALHIGCNSRHSFRLYFLRIISKQDTWCTLFEKRGEKKLVNLPLDEKWERIETGLKDWTAPEVTDHWRAYGHTILVHKKMGLGP